MTTLILTADEEPGTVDAFLFEGGLDDHMTIIASGRVSARDLDRGARRDDLDILGCVRRGLATAAGFEL